MGGAEMPITRSLSDIVTQLGGQVSSDTPDSSIQIHRVGSLIGAQAGVITFFANTKHSELLKNCQASAVVLQAEHAHLTRLPKIIAENPYAYFAKVSALFNPPEVAKSGIHASAVVDQTAVVPVSCSIGANAVIAANVQFGEHVVIGAGCVIERGCIIGAHTLLEANVTLKHHTKIGQHCHFYSGCVIGNDGFGYAEDAGRWTKIPQVGNVVIHDFVDIGANTTIDRGAIDDTVIEEGVKLDNLIHIAHNCHIGAHTVIAGCVGIAGSAIIGKHCQIGGAAMILGHLSIVDNCIISPGSMIMKSITQAGKYTAIMPSFAHRDWLKAAANIHHITELADKIKAIEIQLNKLKL